MGETLHREANRLKGVAFSPVREVLERANKLASEGRSIIHFEIGEPDFDTPARIVEATKEALDKGLTHYGPNRGLLSLRKEIARKLREENGLEYDPETEILITVGGAEAIIDVMLACIDEGDEVITFPPTFMNYRNCIALAGGKEVRVPLKKEDGFQIDTSALRAALSEKTRMMIFANPNNPTGTVFREETLRELAEIAIQNDLIVLSDEIYADITYDGVKSTSIASLPGMKERTYVVSGFSKNYAMTGFRLGYYASHPRLVTNALKLHQYVTTCAPTFIQDGMARAMLHPETLKDRAKMVETFGRRREILLSGIEEIPGLSAVRPQAAFYLFIDVSKTGLSGVEFAKGLLEERGVALVPGAGFGEGGEDFVRISYAASEGDIREGLSRIKQYVEDLV